MNSKVNPSKQKKEPRFFRSDSYTDGRTKQAFKDQTDINKILHRAAKGDTISHLAKHGAVYGDFSDIDDLMQAHDRLQKGMEIFEALPGEVKREFNQSPQEFFNFVNDPKNADDLARVLPQLAAPGTQMPAPRRTAEAIARSDRDTIPPETAPEADSQPTE